MTLHQPFYELDKANMQELYLFLGVAALLVIIPVIAVFIWSKVKERKRRKSLDRMYELLQEYSKLKRKGNIK